MEKNTKTRCGNTGREGVAAAIDQLIVWSYSARRHAEALSRAAKAADTIVVMWDHMSDEQKARLEEDLQLRNNLRSISGFYGYNCT